MSLPRLSTVLSADSHRKTATTVNQMMDTVDSTRMVLIPSFWNAASVSVPSAVSVIETGEYRPGSSTGGGRYLRWNSLLPALPAPVAGENAWWFTSADGGHWYPDPTYGLSFHQFGAACDAVQSNIGQPGTWTYTIDDYPAWLAFHDSYLPWFHTNMIEGLHGNYRSTPRLLLPPGKASWIGGDINITNGAVHIKGQHLGAPNGGNSFVFAMAPGYGWFVNYVNTTLQTTRTEGVGAMGSTFEGFVVEGTGYGSRPATDGFLIRAFCRLRLVTVRNMPRHGINIEASVGAGGSSEGNASQAVIEQCQLWRNGGSGVRVHGSDANIVAVRDCYFGANQRWGAEMRGAFGSKVENCHAASNGFLGSSIGPTYSTETTANGCSYGGVIYYVVVDREADASTETPGTGTAWATLGQAGTPSSSFPAWVSGMTWATGGAYMSSGGPDKFDECYGESGQPPSQGSGSGQALISGGLHAEGAINIALEAPSQSILQSWGGYQAIDNRYGKKHIRAIIGGVSNANNDIALSIGHDDYSTNIDSVYLHWRSDKNWELKDADSNIVLFWTTPFTTGSWFGFSPPSAGYTWIPKFVVGGNQTEARRLNFATTPSGVVARGDIIWTPNMSASTSMGVAVTTSGTIGSTAVTKALPSLGA